MFNVIHSTQTKDEDDFDMFLASVKEQQLSLTTKGIIRI